MDLSNVRIREHFGLVSNNTHTGQFTFLISPPKNRSGLEKHDYILLDHPLFGDVCQILAVITDITSYEEVAGGSSIGDKMGKMLATAEIVGYVDLRNENKPLIEVLVPPNPGGRVYVPLKKFLEDILNRNTKGETFKAPIEIGMFENSSAEDQENQGRIKCFLDVQDLTSKHTLIAAGPGAGKTHLGKLLLQEISSKISAQIILFDSYNEYSNVIKTAKVEINGKTDRDSLSKMIKKGSVTVLNAQGMELEEKRSFFLESLQIILKLRLENKITSLFLIIEEAENLKGEVLNQAVVEGRKIGISICLLTTNPSDLEGKILSQMGYQIIGKTTNKEDTAYLSSIAGTTNKPADLAVGEWIISGISNNRPTKVRLN
jgi:DNA helicase HerA-like ATPase